MLLPVAVFVLILAIVLGSYWAFVIRTEQSEERAVRQRLTNGSSKARKPMLVNEGVRQSSVAALDALLPRNGQIKIWGPIANLQGVHMDANSNISAALRGGCPL